MRTFAATALLVVAIVSGACAPAFGQSPPREGTPPVVPRGAGITPLGGYVLGSIAAAAIAPMVATVILRRELTFSEAYHVIFGSVLGPIGWLLADALVPPGTVAVNPPGAQPPGPPRSKQR